MILCDDYCATVTFGLRNWHHAPKIPLYCIYFCEPPTMTISKSDKAFTHTHTHFSLRISKNYFKLANFQLSIPLHPIHSQFNSNSICFACCCGIKKKKSWHYSLCQCKNMYITPFSFRAAPRIAAKFISKIYIEINQWLWLHLRLLVHRMLYNIHTLSDI